MIIISYERVSYSFVQNNFDLLFIETFTDDSPLSTPHRAQEYQSENSLRI